MISSTPKILAKTDPPTDHFEKMPSQAISSKKQVAMLCKGDDAYGVASVLKLYAHNAPEIHFVCLGPGPMYEWLKQNGNQVHLVEGLSTFTATSSSRTLLQLPFAMLKARRSAAKLHDLFQRLGIHVVHAHWLAQHMIAGHLRSFGYDSVWHIHGNMNPRRMFGIGARLNHLLAKWGADLLIPVSNFIGANWQGAGVPMQVIHNVAPVIFDAPNDPTLNPIRCVIAGRLTEDKGHHLAIQAVLSARAAGYDVRLDIFGGPLESNSYYDQLKTLVDQSKQPECIRFMGFSSNLREQHQSYNLGLQCRISPEPCSMWVCETLVDGLPLLAADAGGTAELIEDKVTGLLFRSGDLNDLTAKLITLLANPVDLKAMRQQAYERGQRLFRLERFISQTFEAYSIAPSRRA